MVADGFEATHLEERGRWLGELAARLAQRGHRVQALSVRALEAWQAPEDPPGITPWRPARAALDSALAQALDQRPDVVHLASTGPWTERAARLLAGAPLVIDAHDYGFACANGDFVRRDTLRACPHRHPHADCGGCAGLSRLREMDARAGLAFTAQEMIAHTVQMRDRLALALGRTVTCIRPGVDPSLFRPEPRSPLSPDVAALFADRDRPRVLFAPRAAATRSGTRDVDLLVALNARVPGVQVVIAGRDPADPDVGPLLLAEAREMGLAEQVVRLPAVAPTDLPALLAACHLVCMTGSSAGTGGLLLMQALAAGVPVLAHPAGCATELVRPGVNGLLLPGGEIGPFAQAAGALLADRAARTGFSDRARLSAIEAFDLERAVFAHEELYRTVRAPSAPPAERAPGANPPVRRSAA